MAATLFRNLRLFDGRADTLAEGMDILVEGERLPLAPLLSTLFRRDPRWLESYELSRIADDERIALGLLAAAGGRMGIAAL